MNKLLTILLCALLLPAAAAAQSVESIKKDKSFIWGEGTGDSFDEADQAALQQLSSQISVWVESNLTVKQKEEMKNGQFNSSQNVSAQTSTFTAAQLTGAKMITLSQEDPCRVFRYISQSDVNAMMEARRERVRSLVATGVKAEQRLQIDDALRNYYWALVLAGNVPGGVDVQIGSDKGSAYSLLPTKINAVVATLAGTVTSLTPEGNTKRADLYFTYAGKPVATLQFKFFDGQNNIGPVGARDGLCQVDLMKNVTDKVRVTYEVKYRQEAENLDPELRLAFQRGKLPSIKSSFDLPLKGVKMNASAHDQQKAQQAAINASAAAADEAAMKPQEGRQKKQMDMMKVPNPADYEAVMARVERALQTANIRDVKDCFTDDAYGLFDTLVNHTGKLSLTGKQQYEFVNTGYQVLARFMKIRMKFKNGRSFMENIVFRFNNEQKIASFAFALTNKAETDIYSASLAWPQVSKYTIAAFMEDYQTAYALRRLDYLDAIFSERALIITGTVLKPGKGIARELHDGQQLSLNPNEPKITYTRLTKSEFLKRLAMQFKSREYIHLTFEENVSKVITNENLPGASAFGIQLKQIYTSPSYSDEGRLSLMLNMVKPDSPMIEVRLWQPMEAKPADLGEFLSAENMGY